MGKTIAGKPVFERFNAKTILSFSIAFLHKLLCSGPILNLGDACVYRCSYCYVSSMLHKQLHGLYKEHNLTHADVVIRRKDAVSQLESGLSTGKACKGADPSQKLVVLTSSTVDPMPTIEMMKETAMACRILLEKTNWDIRVLTKSTFLPKFVEFIPEEYHRRLILGVSTGTLDDELGKVIEAGTPLVSKRIESLHWLQDHGFRTFGMICPSLPQDDYAAFSKAICNAIRVDRCEHVWAEVINVRGDSFQLTKNALSAAGFLEEVKSLKTVCGPGSSDAWNQYAQETFLAHVDNVPAAKLRFLQYPSKKSLDWWQTRKADGAILLGCKVHPKGDIVKKSCPSPKGAVLIAAAGSHQNNGATLQTAAQRAWTTIRETYSPDTIKAWQKAAGQKASATRLANKQIAK